MGRALPAVDAVHEPAELERVRVVERRRGDRSRRGRSCRDRRSGRCGRSRRARADARAAVAPRPSWQSPQAASSTSSRDAGVAAGVSRTKSSVAVARGFSTRSMNTPTRSVAARTWPVGERGREPYRKRPAAEVPPAAGLLGAGLAGVDEHVARRRARAGHREARDALRAERGGGSATRAGRSRARVPRPASVNAGRSSASASRRAAVVLRHAELDPDVTGPRSRRRRRGHPRARRRRRGSPAGGPTRRRLAPCRGARRRRARGRRRRIPRTRFPWRVMRASLAPADGKRSGAAPIAGIARRRADPPNPRPVDVARTWQ